MKTMKQRKYFDVMDYDKEAEYLSEMHRHGWKFTKVTGLGCYHFEECEPADIRYQLDYNQEGLANKAEYCQMFEDMGWEYLQDFVGYSYFRKPAGEGDDDEIFCDVESRLDMMNRVFRGRIIPLIILFCLFIIPMLAQNVFFHQGPAFLIGFISPVGALFVLYVLIFIRFAVKYRSFKERIGK